MQAAGAERYERVRVDWELGEGERGGWGIAREETREVQVRYHEPEEEIA